MATTTATKQGRRMNWQLDAWHAISRAAKHQHCFPEADYKGDGLLDLDNAKFARLREWLDRKSREPHPAVSATLPSWQHFGECKWRLSFQGNGLSADGSLHTKRVQTSVVVSDGLVPEAKAFGERDDEWQLVEEEDDGIPSSTGLPTGTVVRPESQSQKCEVM